MSDARFEDGGDKPLRLKALDGEDLTVLSSLAQDAVFPASEMKWDRKARRFAVTADCVEQNSRGKRKLSVPPPGGSLFVSSVYFQVVF